MWYRLLADAMLVLHLAWILFMLYGFALTVRAFWRPAYWNRTLFRSLHLVGILFVASKPVLGEYCPLTVWEYELRRHYNPTIEYPGSFVIGYLEKLVYPDISPLVYLLPTFAIAAFTLVMFVVKPPARLWQWRRQATRKSKLL